MKGLFAAAVQWAGGFKLNKGHLKKHFACCWIGPCIHQTKYIACMKTFCDGAVFTFNILSKGLIWSLSVYLAEVREQIPPQWPEQAFVTDHRCIHTLVKIHLQSKANRLPLQSFRAVFDVWELQWVLLHHRNRPGAGCMQWNTQS